MFVCSPRSDRRPRTARSPTSIGRSTTWHGRCRSTASRRHTSLTRGRRGEHHRGLHPRVAAQPLPQRQVPVSPPLLVHPTPLTHSQWTSTTTPKSRRSTPHEYFEQMTRSWMSSCCSILIVSHLYSAQSSQIFVCVHTLGIITN